MKGVCKVIADGNILRLIEKFLRIGVMEDGVFKPTTVGTPQGGVISPLLANLTEECSGPSFGSQLLPVRARSLSDLG